MNEFSIGNLTVEILRAEILRAGIEISIDGEAVQLNREEADFLAGMLWHYKNTRKFDQKLANAFGKKQRIESMKREMEELKERIMKEEQELRRIEDE